MAQSIGGIYNPHYIKLLPRYKTIRDCINDDVVTGDYTCLDEISLIGSVQYLVRTPGMSDETYSALKQLGRFLNVTGSTLDMMMGAAWRVPPTVEMATATDYLNMNADGEGNSLLDLAKDALADTMSMGRFGVLVEPEAQQIDNNGMPIPRSKSDIAKGIGRTYAKPYTPESIIDYDVSVVNGVKKLSFVKLEETVTTRNETTHQTECETIYRFLILDDDGYKQKVFDGVEGSSQIGETITVTDYNGKPLDHIPFFFSGSRNNDPTPDNPPFYKIADRNIAHYNNDANNRLNIILYATGTLFVTGDNPDLGKKNLTVGGGNGFYLGETGSASLLQLDAGTALPEAIKADLEDMVMLGAKISNPSVQRTAEEARISAGQETALLSDVIGNVQSMLREVINEINMLMTGSEQEFTFSMGTQFFLETLTAQDRAQFMAEYMSGIIPFETLFNAYKRAGLIPHDETIDEFKVKIESDGMGQAGFGE